MNARGRRRALFLPRSTSDTLANIPVTPHTIKQFHARRAPGAGGGPIPRLSIVETLFIGPELAPYALETRQVYRVEELPSVGEFGQDLRPERLDLDLDVDRPHIAVEDEGNDPVRRAAECLGASPVGESLRGGFEESPFEIPFLSRNGDPPVEVC